MKGKDRERLKEKLAKNHVCYVLITCAEPSADGDMKVEMSYEGDAALASYLLQGAQSFIDDQEDDTQPLANLGISQSKIVAFAPVI